MAKLSDVVSKFALPSVGTFLVVFGLGGKQLPGVDAILSTTEGWLASHTSFPSLVVMGVTIIAAWAVYQLMEWRYVRQREQWRGNLIKLMKEGVGLRNEGAERITTKQAAQDWILKADSWCTRVFNEIKRLDANAAEDYELLDVVPKPRINISTGVVDHAREFGWHDFRVLKLRGLVKDTQT
jgi:hypothetical protein